MNPEISKNKFDKFVNRESVQETMDLLISVLSAMYESDQQHKIKDPMETLKERLGISAPKQKGLNGTSSTAEIDKDEIENL